MVDFQSRDSRRSHDDEQPSEDDADAGQEEEANHEHEHDNAHDDHAHDDHDHAHDHHHAHDVETLGVAVVTVSSSRTLDDDPSGDAIEAVVDEAGDEVVIRELVADDYDGVQQRLDELTGRDDVDAVVTTGGTGVTPDDVTVEAANAMFDKELPGFGELFRSLSREEIGTQVVATRATAGIVDGVPVFCLPGSESAARLGTSELIVEEAGHLAGLATRE